MKERLLVVADLGRLKAYKLQEGRQFSHPRLELVEDSETGVTRHLSEELTDQAGRFRRSTAHSEAQSALSDGEQHNIDLERRRRAVKTLAQRISEIMDREKTEEFYLAADKRINQQLLDEMPTANRTKLQKNVPMNLSKLSTEELVKHFCE
jgi:hypothetical protein